MKSGKKVTLQNIADKIGVTKVTVSKALSGKDGVSDEMRSKIRKLAVEMGYYTKNTSGRSQSSYTSLALLVPEVFLEDDEFFYTRLFKNIYEQAAANDFMLMLNVVHKSEESSYTIPPALSTSNCHGIILLGQLSEPYVEFLKTFDLPIVMVDFYYPNVNLNCIITDNLYGMYEATNYLISLGHTEIGFVGNFNLTSSIQDRYLGYCKALLDNHIEMNPGYHLLERDNNGKWLDFDIPSPSPTAFVCNNDRTAHRLLSRLTAKGYRVPDDVSVIGFDDILHSAITMPQITTVRVDQISMAANTISTMKKLLNSFEVQELRIVIPTAIIERDSCKRIHDAERTSPEPPHKNLSDL